MIGDRSIITLTATSNQDDGKTAEAVFVSAVPAPFVHAYRNTKYSGSYGVNLEMVAPRFRRSRLVNDHYSGAVYILNGLAEGSYLSMWEQNVSSGTNLEYQVVDSIGIDQFNGLQVLVDNSGTSQQDILPTAAKAPNGKVGVAWIRKIIVDPSHFTENVYLAILNAQADTILTGPINVTNDLTNYAINEYQAIYRDVVMAATGDNHYYLSWRNDGDFLGGTATQEMFHAVFDDEGAAVKPPEMLTTPASNMENNRPALIEYDKAGEKVLLLFFQVDNQLSSPTSKILYTIRDSSGGLISPLDVFYELGEQNGSGLDGVDLQDGRLAVAWTDLIENRVNYVIVGSDLSKPAQPNVLENPDDLLGWRAANYVSITTGGEGSAILTSFDSSFKERIYYAQVDDNGPSGLLVPAMVFRSLQPGIERELEIKAGWGNAAYISIWQVNLPIIRS